MWFLIKSYEYIQNHQETETMPRRPSPNSLISNCLTAVAKNLEILSYGCEKGSAELRDLIDTEYFLQIKGDLKGDSFLCCKVLNH